MDRKERQIASCYRKIHMLLEWYSSSERRIIDAE